MAARQGWTFSMDWAKWLRVSKACPATATAWCSACQHQVTAPSFQLLLFSVGSASFFVAGWSSETILSWKEQNIVFLGADAYFAYRFAFAAPSLPWTPNLWTYGTPYSVSRFDTQCKFWPRKQPPSKRGMSTGQTALEFAGPATAPLPPRSGPNEMIGEPF